MARLIDYIPMVLEALIDADGSMKQTELTVAVWGTSGRGNQRLTEALFPFMVRSNYMTLTKIGRSKLYSITEYGTKRYNAYIDIQHAIQSGISEQDAMQKVFE